MNIKPKQKKQKGVALIFALFTIAILFSISTTVVALSMHHRQDSQVMSYNDAALQAANWGLEAAINYMGQPGRKFKVANTFQDTGTQWIYSYFSGNGNGYDSYRLSSQDAGGNATVAGGAIGVSVQELRSEDLKKFGLDYREGKVPASGESVGDSKRDTWRYGDSVLIRFQKGNGGLYPLMYPGGFRGQGEEMAYGVVEVVCTEIRTLNQPSTYELMAVANVMQCASGTGDARLPYAANNNEFLVEVPSEKGVLASRVVTANVRQMMASDFMHFIQNGRSWDATGVDLWSNTVAQSRVFIPEGYRESGRLRVDGYDAKKDPENNPLKAYLGDGINGRNGKKLDGSLAFLYTGGDFETDRYAFPGDVTTMRPAAEFETKKIGAGEPEALQGETAMFSGQLRDATPSLGLPDAEDYFEKIHDGVDTRAPIADSKWRFEVGKEGENVKTVRWNQSGESGKCPDIAQAKAYREDGKGGWEAYGSATPTFATIRVEICGNEARVIKYNAAMTTDRQLLGTSQSSSNGGKQGSRLSSSLDPNYIEVLEDWTNLGTIKNNVISVTGGNVEVVNVKTRSGEKICEDYVDATSKSGNNFMEGELTIVANVDSSRDRALQSIQQDKNATPTDGGIYKVRAREFWEENPYVNIPPFSASELGIGSGTEKKYWPSPANSSIEREGNVIIGSDIRQNATGASGGQALGIVAKNFIYLNDKSGAQGDDSLNNLVVDAVLMSMDHSVQMDWNNMGGNKYHDDLITDRSEKNGNVLVPFPVQDAIKDPTNKTQRRFTLNGAIVSGFMDVEGDTTGAGYFDQKFTHDPNLLYNLPPNFPKWSLTDSTDDGCFMDFMMLSYKDHGAILNLGY